VPKRRRRRPGELGAASLSGFRVPRRLTTTPRSLQPGATGKFSLYGRAGPVFFAVLCRCVAEVGPKTLLNGSGSIFFCGDQGSLARGPILRLFLGWLHFGQRDYDRSAIAAAVAALWEGILNLLRVGHRSIWRSGRPRVPRRPFQKVGGFSPHLLQGSPGSPGPPRPPK
jgi:hypothetical protein